MKRFAILTAAALTMSGSAYAYTGVSSTMISSVEGILAENGMNDVVLSSLTDEQIVEIYAAGQSSEGEELSKIKAVLNDEGVARAITDRRIVLTESTDRGLMPMGENTVVTSVQNFLDMEGFEVDASALSDAQIAELYFLAHGDDESPSRDEVETVLNM